MHLFNTKCESFWRECNQTHVTIYKRKNCHISQSFLLLLLLVVVLVSFCDICWWCTMNVSVCAWVRETKSWKLSNAYETGIHEWIVGDVQYNAHFKEKCNVHVCLQWKLPLKCWKTLCSLLTSVQVIECSRIRVNNMSSPITNGVNVSENRLELLRTTHSEC